MFIHQVLGKLKPGDIPAEVRTRAIQAMIDHYFVPGTVIQAGVGSYYGPFDAHHIFDTLWEGALLTRPLKIDITFFCNKCFGMATGKTCPHGEEDRIHISGTQQRAMLAEGAPVPREFGRPEVIEILRAYYASLS